MGSNSEIKKVLDQWQAWGRDAIFHKYPRNNLGLKFIAKNAIALIGVRRSGKTYYALDLAERESKNFLYMNFEDPYFIASNTTAELDRIIEVYTEFSEKEPQLLVLDEIQNIESWERWVRKQVDLGKYSLVITGSSAKLLSSEIASSLTGRNITHHIWPLAFNEFLDFSNQVSENFSVNEYLAYFKKYMLEGAFPAVVELKDEQERKLQLQQYFEDILNKDIIKRYQIRSTHSLYLIADYYITNLSSLHSTHSVKKALNINAETVGDYTKYLEDAFLIYAVQRYHPNLKVQTRDAKKIYVIDTGLRNAISRSVSEDWGKLAENIVYIELRRRGKEVYYYKEEGEVDFIITENFKAKEAIQVSYSDLENADTYERELGSLLQCLTNLKLDSGLILTRNREEIIYSEGKKITMIPIYKWLMQVITCK